MPVVRRRAPLIRTLVMLGFWAALLPVAALIGFPWTLLTGDVSMLYRMTMWGAFTGVRLAGAASPGDRLRRWLVYLPMSDFLASLNIPLSQPFAVEICSSSAPPGGRGAMPSRAVTSNWSMCSTSASRSVRCRRFCTMSFYAAKKCWWSRARTARPPRPPCWHGSFTPPVCSPLS